MTNFSSKLLIPMLYIFIATIIMHLVFSSRGIQKGLVVNVLFQSDIAK